MPPGSARPIGITPRWSIVEVVTRFRVVDAFTDRAFAGNPAAVIVLDELYDDTWAQRVAAEFNLAATAFVLPYPGADADHELRWFDPATELDLCGHGTLATARALLADGATGPLRFATSVSGVLTVTPRDGLLWMDFPANPPSAVDVPAGLDAALGANAVWVGSAATGDLLVEVDGERTVRELEPDIPVLVDFAARGVIVTARADEGRPYAFVSRFLAPRVGVAEDPVTGSAHTVLTPFWSDRLDRTALTALQCSARGGQLRLELPENTPDRVLIGGSAVTVSEGRLFA